MCNSYYSPILQKYCINGRNSDGDELEIPDLEDPEDCYYQDECKFYFGKTCLHCEDYNMLQKRGENENLIILDDYGFTNGV